MNALFPGMRRSRLSDCRIAVWAALNLGFDGHDLIADEIAKLFPNLYGQPWAKPVATKVLKIGVVLPGGQAPWEQLIGIFGKCE